MKELINSNRLTLKIKDSKLETNHSHAQIFTRWNNLLQTTSKNEEQLQTDFLNDIFGEVLGFSYKRGESETNLEKEEKTELDGQKPDGILGFFTAEGKDCRVVIELKDSKTNLDAKQNRKGDNRSPVDRAFGYVSKYQGIEFVIVSNFKEIRLYRSNYQGKYQEFKMEDLASSEAKRKEFQFLLCKENLIGITKDTGSLVKKLLDDETKRETEIQNKFYKEYKALREEFVNDILKQNGTTPDTAIAKAQKLFDRLLFIRFCEDNNLITKPFEKVDAGKALGLNLWEALKLLFTSIDKGNPPHIHKFNGGLFATDEVFNDIRIEAKLLERLIAFLRLYHFKNDISVNILGHIFEQSITDSEALKAGLNDETHNKKEGKRKKDGIFYTPEYITKYIVEEAVGGWLKERKEELQLTELTPQEIPTTKPKKWTNPNQELIDRYKLYAEKLKQIKVLDPACGSGAFLVEVFNYLENEWLSLSETLKKLGDDTELGLFDYQTVYKSILQNNIYGVDLNSESVQITKLSLWLKTANSRDELTTLDNNIKVGNSLIDDQNIDQKAFKWEEEFPFKFDVVVGNPPYVFARGGNFSDTVKDYYYKNYKTAEYQLDTFILFIEKAHSLMKNDSNFGMIIPNTILANLFIPKIREYLLSNTAIKSIGLCNKVFENVNVDTIVLSTQKRYIENNQININQVTENEKTFLRQVAQDNFKQNQDYTFSITVDETASKIITKMRDKTLKMEEVCDISSGIKEYQVGKGKPTQIQNDKETLKFHANYKKDDTYLPEIRGYNIDRYSLSWKNEYISYGEWLAEPRQLKFFEGERILMRQIPSSLRLICSYSKENFIIDQTIYIAKPVENIPLNPLYVLATLNSKLLYWYFANTNNEFDKLFPKIKVGQFKGLPIKIISLAEQQPFIQKAQAMLTLTKELNELSSAFLDYLKAKMGNPEKLSTKLQKWYSLKDDEFLTELNKLAKSQKLTSFDERAIFTAFKDDGKKAKEMQSIITRTDMEIDSMVYALYGLSEEEVGVVECLVI